MPTPANGEGAGEGAAQANGEGAVPQMTNEDWEGPSEPSVAFTGERGRRRSLRRGAEPPPVVASWRFQGRRRSLGSRPAADERIGTSPGTSDEKERVLSAAR